MSYMPFEPSAFMNPIYQTIQGAGNFSVSEAQFTEIRKGLEDTMRKSADLGYQTPASGDPNGGNYSPLLLQSIDDRLADKTTYGVEDFVFFNLLPQDQASQTVHEIRSKISKGDRFLALQAGEGDIGAVDDSEYEFGSVRMKYWVTTRQLTYQAQNTPNVAWVESSALTLETDNAMVQLRRALEIDSMWGDSTINGLEVDGVITQLDSEASTFSEDLGGQQLTFNRVTRTLAMLSNVDIGAHPTHLLVTPDVYADLEIQAIHDGAAMRFQDGQGTISTREFTYGATGFEIFVPGSNRKIPVVKVPFLDLQRAYGSPFKPGTTDAVAAKGDAAKRPPLPVITAVNNLGTTAGSKFKAADAGTYQYWVIARNKYGRSQAVTASSVPVAAGDCVELLLTDPGADLVTDYLVFRTDKTAAIASARFLFRTKYNTNGTAGAVQILDKNEIARGTSRALLLNLKDKEEIAFYRFLPLARIPLPMIGLQIPFAVFMSGAPKVKVPRKQYQFKNVGVANPT